MLSACVEGTLNLLLDHFLETPFNSNSLNFVFIFLFYDQLLFLNELYVGYPPCVQREEAPRN